MQSTTAIQFKQKNTKIKWTAQTLANDFWKMTRQVSMSLSLSLLHKTRTLPLPAFLLIFVVRSVDLLSVEFWTPALTASRAIIRIPMYPVPQLKGGSKTRFCQFASWTSVETKLLFNLGLLPKVKHPLHKYLLNYSFRCFIFSCIFGIFPDGWSRLRP